LGGDAAQQGKIKQYVKQDEGHKHEATRFEGAKSNLDKTLLHVPANGHVTHLPYAGRAGVATFLPARPGDEP